MDFKRFVFSGIPPLILLGGLLIFYSWALLHYLVPVTGGTDQNGYHVCARTFNLEGKFYRKPIDKLEFIGSMWVVNDRGEYYPKYPPLYPLLAAGMNAMLGPGGGFYATLWGAVLAAAGIFVLARFFLGPWYALLATAAAICSPVLSALAVTKNSHTPSLALFVWGMAAFFTALAPQKRQWLRILLAAAAGFLIAYCTGIRYTDFLLILVPTAAAFLFARRRKRRNLLLGLAAGAVLPFGAMALFHWYAYGAPWRSGYSLTDESSAFVPSFILSNLRIYVPEFFLSVIGPLGTFALLFFRFRRRRLFFWLIWLMPTFVLYLMYYWAPEGGGTGAMRFLVPLVPAVILLALLSLRRVVRLLPGRKPAALTLLAVIAVQIVWGIVGSAKLCESKAAADFQHLVRLEVLRNRIPEGAVIIASSGILNELDFERRWQLYPSYILNVRQIQNTISRSLDAQAAGLQKIRALELRDELGGLNYGKLYEKLRNFFEEKRKEGHPVYFIGRTWEANSFRRAFHRHFELEELGLITGERPAHILVPIQRSATRFVPDKLTVPMQLGEIVKVGARREKVLPLSDSERVLQQERREIMERLTPDNDAEIRRDLERLEAIRDEVQSLRRAAAEAKRRAELRRKAAEKRKAELRRKAEEKRKAEFRRKAEEKRKAELRRKAEEKRRAEEKRKAEEKRSVEKSPKETTAEESGKASSPAPSPAPSQSRTATGKKQ